jgi:hypothetical protein
LVLKVRYDDVHAIRAGSAPPRADQSSGLKYEQADMGDDAAVADLVARTYDPRG